ncbi:hypothetical protein LXL04_024159 [Taraxacum kok-saghyz]
MGMIKKMLEALLKQREEILIPNLHVNEIRNNRDPPNSASTLKSTSNLVPMYNSHVNRNWIPISFPNPASNFNSDNHVHKGTPHVNRFFVIKGRKWNYLYLREMIQMDGFYVLKAIGSSCKKFLAVKQEGTIKEYMRQFVYLAAPLEEPKSGDSLILIDCGATHNFISLEVVSNLKLVVDNTESYNIDMGIGMEVKENGVCRGVRIFKQGLEILKEFLI